MSNTLRSSTSRMTRIAAACLFAGLCTRVDAQRTATGLSVETQQFVTQDPAEVLRALHASLKRPVLTKADASCRAIPVPEPGPAHDRSYFLSEVGGCAQLACFLEQVPSTVHANATLIVDQACTGAQAITETLVLPDRFTLAGVGIDGGLETRACFNMSFANDSADVNQC